MRKYDREKERKTAIERKGRDKRPRKPLHMQAMQVLAMQALTGVGVPELGLTRCLSVKPLSMGAAVLSTTPSSTCGEPV